MTIQHATYSPYKIDEEKATALPTDRTIYLGIELDIPPVPGEKPVPPITAVYAPNPDELTPQVNILLWLTGHKGGALKNLSAKQYLADPRFQLRKFATTGNSKRKYILVVPTLGNGSEAGFLNRKDQAEMFLFCIVNAVRDYLNSSVCQVGDIVLAAHSGGGAIMSKMAKFGGLFNQVTEIWCMDCTYGSGTEFKDWAANPNNKNGKLWVYATGKYTDTEGEHDGTAAGAEVIKTAIAAAPAPPANIEERILNPPSQTANWTYGGAPGHNESIGTFFSELVRTSKTLG